MNKQQGFTLIELVMVIVILGILAATAIPKFVDLKGEAQAAAVQGIAGNLGAGSAINFAVASISPAQAVAITSCTDLDGTLEGGLPPGYAISAGAITAGSTATCRVVGTFGTTTVGEPFTGHRP